MPDFGTADTKMRWLNTALDGQPASVKAHVLDFCIKFGVDGQDDDFWVLIAAIGFLHTIVATAPETWQTTLDNFSQQLELWSNSNLKTLSSLTNQAEANAQQAELLNDLITSLNALTQQLPAPGMLARQEDSGLMKLNSEFLNFREALNYRLNELNQNVQTHSKTLLSSRNTSNGGPSAIATDDKWSSNYQSNRNGILNKAFPSPKIIIASSLFCWILLLSCAPFSADTYALNRAFVSISATVLCLIFAMLGLGFPVLWRSYLYQEKQQRRILELLRQSVSKDLDN